MPEVNPSRYRVQAGWKDVPHISQEAKAELLRSTQPYLRKARSEGEPSLGSGAIYPMDTETITCAPFAIPAFWPRSFALDVGWNKTAALWSAWDPSDGVRYIYAEYGRGEAEPIIHVTAIKARGDWIPGVVDPASRGRSQTDGRVLYDQYVNFGLNLTFADNTVHGDDGGIHRTWTALGTGRTKIFTSLTGTLAEIRVYRRDEKGKIVKANDHFMDCMRYGEMSGKDIARVAPARTFGPISIGHSPADKRAGY